MIPFPLTSLITVIFLLSTGAPAKQARVICPDMTLFVAGEDAATRVSGLQLQLDSRGGTVIEGSLGGVYFCEATQENEYWSGTVNFMKHGKVFKFTLQPTLQPKVISE